MGESQTWDCYFWCPSCSNSIPSSHSLNITPGHKAGPPYKVVVITRAYEGGCRGNFVPWLGVKKGGLGAKEGQLVSHEKGKGLERNGVPLAKTPLGGSATDCVV